LRRNPGAVALALLGMLLVACGAAAPASAAIPAWTTYHHDAARSGIDPDSSTPVSPTQLWQTPTLQGHIWGQPLIYGSRVYVATEHDQVYALDAATGRVLWQRSAGSPVPSGELACGDIDPEVGITSTPVIDPATNKIYVVAANWDGSAVSRRLIGFDLTSGAPTSPRNVDPPGQAPKDVLQRASLALDGNEIVIGYGGNDGDCGTYHGWLVAAREDGTGPLLSYQVSPPTAADPGSYGGAIWGAGSAPAIDASGYIYAATGNGFGTSSYNGSESVLKLDGSLHLVDHWAPKNWAALDASDTDLGSSEPLPLPGGMLFQTGKDGNGYLLRSAALGGTGAVPAAQLHICSGGSFGGGVYFFGTIYVACSDGLRAVSVNTSTPSLSLKPGWTVTGPAIGPPIVAGGLVWVVGWGGGELFGLDPSSGAVRFSENLGSFMHFASPSAGGGSLFVANDNQVTALRIARPPAPASTATTLASSANPSPSGATVTLTATIAPAPDSGTVSFADGAATLAGCAAVAVSPATGRATCTTTFGKSGAHAIVASYSGDASLAGSRSAALRQVVATAGGKRGKPPTLTALSLTASTFRVGHGTTLRVTLSERATLVVAIEQLLPGRRPAGRAKLKFRARRGRDHFRLALARLAPGRYIANVTARDAAGRVSIRRSVRFTLTRR
jgi:outer membrane protein assembly factor BamB